MLLTVIAGGCASVSPTQENNSTVQASSWFVEKYGLVSSPGLSQLLTRVQAQLRIASATLYTNDPGELRIVVFNYREPLAFSSADGEILLSKGLLLALQSEDEVGAVLAHELGHSLIGHLKDKQPIKSGSPQLLLSIEQEKEADKLSLNILAATSYNPEAALTALRRLAKESAPEREQALVAELSKSQARFESTVSNRLFRRAQAELAGHEASIPSRFSDY